MAVFRLEIAYDGGSFAGWAAQPGQRTIQGELEAALERILGAPAALTVELRLQEAEPPTPEGKRGRHRSDDRQQQRPREHPPGPMSPRLHLA